MSYSSEWKALISNFGFGFVNDLNQYKHIVKIWAYADMQPRTISGLGKFRKASNNNANLNILFDVLAEKLFDYIINQPSKGIQEFDSWHKEICNYFFNEFNNICGEKVNSIGFGKAQKIVNVAFKYIFCLKGSEQYADKFKPCHMVLDRYTYSGDYGIDAFYKNEVIPWYNQLNPGMELDPKKLTRWSNLDEKEYREIQKNIRNFLSSSSKYVNDKGESLTPFQAEFYLFDKYNAR